ncbi:PP2C family protein-serine/threonine phosphatase [Cellulomonas fimi]|uniref:Protein serine phosphatase with GAF(S) sensor(S) n=1 Tax=Cellulomonas fimi (strain ATCC 484 / DSM 20113 / JCM 1341 / CCUG 24087 / LMG 16345 / NBRC 15513 / NCIMB 8980 / NCTC 7547 / NRS-133) TaxID=590998 RepID=F4H3M7_CELFA|nr:SpoIIE family protein phosphatase [Cellulomonas fimi]AEE47693.1 protein serine phosphatase with GAF(s) sensor(s) [Cellulomonas fimi ATCC 484]NNH07448.1 SpoIIE family protein phosphatase [Cellulomonas fimi]VEH36810.1 Phosphoserine phosphatase rsbU [Cellulomonas fimi]
MGVDTEDARLAALHGLDMLDTPPEERFDRVVRLAQQLFGVPTAFVSLVDRDRLFYKAKVGLEQQEAPRDTSFCRLTIEQPETFVVEDATRDPRFDTNPWVVDDPRLRFYAGHPLVAPGGHRVGTLCLMDVQPREFGAQDAVLLRDLASWVEQELVVDDDLQRAAQVQAGLLPRTVPVVPGYDVAGACLPARGVGGDFFDWAPTDGGLTLTLADVMGKGGGAAIIAATVRAVLRAASRRGTVAEAVATAEESLALDLSGTSMFATAFHAHLDAPTGRVHYVDAGHGLSVVVRADGRTTRLEPGGAPLGFAAALDPDAPPPVRDAPHVDLAPGDLLVAFSDGVLDVLDGTLASVDEVAHRLTGASSASDAVDRVLALARGAADRPDDLTVVAVHREQP